VGDGFVAGQSDHAFDGSRRRNGFAHEVLV
jgi:hypothetical protein